MVIVITGKQGVGKTSLGLQFLNNFKGTSSTDYRVKADNVMIDAITSVEQLKMFMTMSGYKNLILICQEGVKFTPDRRKVCYIKLKK